MTERLRKCLEAGNVIALFPLLKDWSHEELISLCADVDAYHEVVNADLNAAWEKAAFQAENFLSKTRSAALDDVVDGKRLDVLSACSEICSVAMYYLPEDKWPNVAGDQGVEAAAKVRPAKKRSDG